MRKHPEARCEDCELYEGEYAPGVGSEAAKIVILGEAPGYQEARTGVPFTGPSGKLLDSVLAHYGISRSEAYIDNVVACRPPDNRTPTKQEIACCWPRTYSEISRRRPDSVVAMGATAGQTILGSSQGITALRVGLPKQSETLLGTKIIPTFHPAYCLRNGDAFPEFVKDIGKLRPTVEVNWTPPTFKVFDDHTAIKALEELDRNYNHVVIDIEVGIEKDTDFGHPDQYQMLCIGFAYSPTQAIVIGEQALQDPQVRQAVRRVLENPNKKWIAHNGKFDLAGLSTWGRMDLYFDTMLASYALDERQGTHGLKYLAVELLGAPPYDDEIHRYVGKGDSYALIPRPILYEYNAYDVACTFQLYEKYVTELHDAGLRPLHDFLCRASMALMASEMEGIKIDIEYLDYLTEHYLDVLEGLEKDLLPWVANPRSPQQVKAALHDMGFNVPDTTKETLELLWERTDPDGASFKFLDLMLEQRKEQKRYGTYVKGIRKRLHKDRVHSSFLLHGTTTGRLSSRNPNLQNIPRESSLRRMFIPEEGNVFVQADYGQIELRIAAVLSGDAYLQEVFSDATRDIFDEVGYKLYGDAALAAETRKERRIRTKAYVYGVGYGREAFSIAQEFRITVQEAQRGMNEYFEQVPQLVSWRSELEESILSDQSDLITSFGRHRRFWLITRDNRISTVKEGWAFLPQSTASDVNLTALCKLREEGFHVRIPVHDSILIECEESAAQSVAHHMKEVMEDTARECLGSDVPFAVDATVGKNWGEV